MTDVIAFRHSRTPGISTLPANHPSSSTKQLSEMSWRPFSLHVAARSPIFHRERIYYHAANTSIRFRGLSSLDFLASRRTLTFVSRINDESLIHHAGKSIGPERICDLPLRRFSVSTKNEDDPKDPPTLPILVYESPFGPLTLKLKRVSLTSAVIGLIGLPTLSFFTSAGSVPASGQFAVIATAGITAVGSTFLLGYCFTPYIHTLEILPATKNIDSEDCTKLLRIVTRDILARKVETIFDPSTDVTPPPSNNSRPFCNFMVKGKPMYLHPDLLRDEELRVQLLGEEQKSGKTETGNVKKSDDDELF